MKRIMRFLGLLMAAALLAGLLPAPAQAAEEFDLKIKGVQVTRDNWMDVLHDGTFTFQYAAETPTLVIGGNCTLDDSCAADAMIESDLDALIIDVKEPSVLTLNKSGADSCIFRLNGDTTIVRYGNTSGALSLVNEGAGGTGILVNNCALTLQYILLDTRDMTYGIRGTGAGASLKIDGAGVRIPGQRNAAPPVTPGAAVSGFKYGITLTAADLVTPEDGKISSGSVREKDGTEALDAEILSDEWNEVFAALDPFELELSTLGRKDPETGKYVDYDIDLADLFGSSQDPSVGTQWNYIETFLLLRGSVPRGMELVLAQHPTKPSRTTLRLRGRPTVPGTAELWLQLFGSGLINGGSTEVKNKFEKLSLTVKYESDTEYYDLWIDGQRAQSGNRDDVLGDGSFSYDPDSKTLTLNKSYTQSWSGALIRSGISGLVIEAPGDVTLKSQGTAFQLEKAARFQGEGALTVRSSGGDGIRVSNGARLTLWNCDLSVEAGGTAVAGSGGGESLYLNNCFLYAKGGTNGVAGFSGGIDMEPNTVISYPTGGKVSGGGIVNTDGSAAKEARVSTVKTYGITIAGTTVTEKNRKDVLENGVFSYDGDKTLTVNGSYEYAGYIIENQNVKDLVIAVAKDSYLNSTESGWGRPMLICSDTTITGPGSLKLRGPSFACALDAGLGGDLTIKDIDITVYGGDWGAIAGGGSMYPNKLTVENSAVKAYGGEYNCAVTGFKDGIELIGCRIEDPQGGKIVSGDITKEDGSTARGVYIGRLDPVTGVKLGDTALTMTAGSSKDMAVTVSPANASLKTVTWYSSDPSVAQVDSAGKVTAVAEGTAIITVKTVDGGMTASCKVTVVPPVHVNSVELNAENLTLPVGNYDFLTADVYPVNATVKTVQWSSSAPGVATVDSTGKVTGVAVGTATITVKTADGGKTAKCTVKVIKAVPVTGVALNKSTLTLLMNESETLTPVFTPAGATNKNVTWTSSNSSVASVNSLGKVTGVSQGTATITVKTKDGGKTATCKVTVKAQVHVTEVKINVSELTLVHGQSPFHRDTLTATVLPANATKPYVTWSSSDPSVALVGEYTGEVTGLKKGTAIITVKSTDGGKTDTCKVTVIDPVYVTGASIDPTMSLYVGESKTITPVFTPSNATNKLVVWQSSDEAIVKVDSYGVVTGVSEGTAAISGKTVDGGKTVLCAVTVTKPKVTGVTLDKTSLSLTVGSAGTLKATVKPDGADNGVTWSSSDKTVATVSSSGKVTAVKAGTAVITVKTKDGGKTAKCTVTVTVPVSGVTLNKTSVTLVAGESIALKATVKPADASDKKVTWSSSKTAVSTVSSSGKVTAVKAGTAVITVKTADGGKTVKCTVTVKNGAISVSEDTLSYKVSLPGSGGKALLVAAWYDAGGRQTGCRIVETARDGLKTGIVSVKKGQSSYRLYVLDSSMKPLMAPLTL